MKVLILGANGMLGQELVSKFSPGNDLTAWDHKDLDITDERDLRLKLEGLHPELVINAAAYNNVDGAESETQRADAVNGYGVGYLAKTCRALDISLVHFSTNYVFDGSKKTGYAEAEPVSPISAYGRSKALGEAELQKNTEKFYLIRTARLFGRETGDSGGKKSFVRLMLELAKHKKEIEVVDEEVSSATYAEDLADQTLRIINGRLPYGIYHGVNSGSCTWFGFAAEIFKIKKIDVKLIPVPGSRFPRPASRPASAILLNTKLPGLRSWQEALKEFLTK